MYCKVETICKWILTITKTLWIRQHVVTVYDIQPSCASNQRVYTNRCHFYVISWNRNHWTLYHKQGNKFCSNTDCTKTAHFPDNQDQADRVWTCALSLDECSMSFMIWFEEKEHEHKSYGILQWNRGSAVTIYMRYFAGET